MRPLFAGNKCPADNGVIVVELEEEELAEVLRK